MSNAPRPVHEAVAVWQAETLPTLTRPRVVVEIGGELRPAIVERRCDDGEYLCRVETGTETGRYLPNLPSRRAAEIFPSIRPSFKPISRCPASLHYVGTEVDAGNDATASGSAAHEIDALIETTGADEGLPDATLLRIAVSHGVTLAEVRDLERTILRHRERMSERLALGDTVNREQRLFVEIEQGLFLIGTVDRLALSADRRSAWVDDLKTGWGFVEAPSHNWQAACYVVAVAATFPAVARVEFSFQYPRQSSQPESATETFLRHDIEADLLPAVRARALDALMPKPRHVTGAQCAQCPARAICPALHSRVLTHALCDDADHVRAAIRHLNPDQRDALADDLIATEAWAKAVRATIRNAVEHEGVEIGTTDGRVFAFAEKKRPKREVNLAALAASVTDNVLAAVALEVGKVPEAKLFAAARRLGLRAADIRESAESVAAIKETPRPEFTLVERADLSATNKPAA